MSHTTQRYDFRAGDSFGLTGYVKTAAPGTLTAYAQLYKADGTQLAILDCDLQAVGSPPPSPYQDYTHTLTLTYSGDTSSWPLEALRTNVLVSSNSGEKVSTDAYVVQVHQRLSRVVS